MAAVIPTFADLPVVNPQPNGQLPNYPAEDPAATAQAAFGGAVNKAGGALVDIGAYQDLAKNKLEESNATLDLVNRLVPLHTQIATETDPNKIAELRQQYDSLPQTSGQAIADPARRQAWMAKHASTILQAHADADKRLTGLDREQTKADGLTRLDAFVRNGATSDDPNAVAGTLAAVHDNLEWQQRYGSMTPLERRAYGEQYTKKLLTGRASHLLNTGRYDEAQKLLDSNPEALDPGVEEHLRHTIEVAKEKAGVKSDTDAMWGGADKGRAGNLGGSAAPHINYGATGALGDPTRPGWEAANLTNISAPSGTSFKVNKAAASDFAGFLKDLEATGYQVDPGQSGGHALRGMRGGSQLSEHAYGTAIDINSEHNPYSKSGQKVTDLPPNISEIAAKHNLEWGGNWKDPVDTMHFQWRGPSEGSASEVKSNNFGGIRKAGVTADTAHGGFESYSTPEAGVQAIADKLDQYAAGGVTTAMNPDGGPLNTIRGIVSTWAPPTENNTDMLIARASRVTGFSPDQPLNLSDPAVKAKMIEATIRNEQGGKLPVPAAVITKIAGTKPGVGGAIDENTDPTTSAQIDAAPASGEPIPLDSPTRNQSPGLPPLPDIDALAQQAQGMADSGQWTQDHANAVMAGLRSRYSHVQAAQANDRAAMKRQLTNGVAMLTDGRDFQYDPAAVRHFFPKEQADDILQELSDAKEGGQIITGLRTASPADIEAQRAQFTNAMNDPNAPDYAKRRKMLGIFDQALQQHQSALIGPKADPVTYLAQYDPLVQQKRAAIDPKNPATFQDYATTALSEQTRLGVPAEQQHIISMNAAQKITLALGADPEHAPDIMKQISAQYGDAWPHVWSDLITLGKMPAGYQVVGQLADYDQGNASILARALGASAKDDVAFKRLVSAKAPGGKSIEQVALETIPTDSRITSYERSLNDSGASPSQVVAIRSAIEHLAAGRSIFLHEDPADATEKAIDAVVGHYEFMPQGGARVPKDQYGAVSGNARVTLDGLTLDNVGVPARYGSGPDQPKPQEYVDMVKAAPNWITGPKADRLLLMDPGGRLVTDPMGKPIAVPFGLAGPSGPVTPPMSDLLGIDEAR